MCIFDKFHLTFNFKSKCHVTFLETKINVNWHLYSLLKCHMPSSTCHFIINVSIDVWFFLHKSYYMSNFEFCSSKWRFFFVCVQVFACQMSKTGKNFCQKYTLLGIVTLARMTLKQFTRVYYHGNNVDGVDHFKQCMFKHLM